ncbi:transcriptional regulator, LysR family [Roseibium hamelinense]|uniref:Transcriptional regulator, LysR family n=1 Tax=Roseibium hamelinense TaxID=150831 RepID=A0A562T144_9HYPH|nr:LysR substrate-binding domain-containing protein [Roseibium hamelinense]MTI44709.1 LysR family transcriptional regulator [Roseibium hamelinense]TWI87339.1 transcriptional regulator, LysR family [Roseibium hamelinense]
MKRAFVPPADALIAFECAARHASFTRAAEELNLTQGAISKQIRHLEDRLGVELFRRVRQRIVLTDAGRIYLHDIKGALEELTDATRQVMSYAGSEDVLNLAVLPTFGTRWLAPRIAGFSKRYPAAGLNLSVRLQPFDFSVEPFDGAIHHGNPVWAGAIAEPLFAEEVIPVASRAFRDRHNINSPAELSRVPRLQLSTRPMAWRQWFDLAGVSTTAAFQGARFEQFVMIAEAAVHSAGAALIPRFFIEDELASGRLVRLFDLSLRQQTAYYFVYPENRTLRPVVKAFRSWLIEEARMARADREAMLPG